MKSTLRLFAFLIFILTTPAFSQVTNFTVAAEGGPSLTTFYRNGAIRDNFKPIAGGYAGILVQYNFSQHFSLRSGLTYERTGTHFTISNGQVYADAKYHFDYLSIPLMIRAEYGKKARFYVNAGPWFSFLCNQDYISQDTPVIIDFAEHVHGTTSPDENKIDFGLAGGIGLNIPVNGKMAISLGVLDYLGLCNTKKQPVYYTSVKIPVNSQTSSYNNSAIFMVGFSINLGKVKQDKAR